MLAVELVDLRLEFANALDVLSGFGTLAGAQPLGIRLAPGSYQIRMTGMDAPAPEPFTIDNVRVDFRGL